MMNAVTNGDNMSPRRAPAQDPRAGLDPHASYQVDEYRLQVV